MKWREKKFRSKNTEKRESADSAGIGTFLFGMINFRNRWG